jgi:hypothetical protein
MNNFRLPVDRVKPGSQFRFPMRKSATIAKLALTHLESVTEGSFIELWRGSELIFTMSI